MADESIEMEEAFPLAVADKTDGEHDSKRRSSVRRSSIVSLPEPRKGDKGDAGEGTCGTRFCEVMKKHQIPIVLLAAAIGIGAGIGLAMWKDDSGTKDTLLIWVELPGDLFLRGLRTAKAKLSTPDDHAGLYDEWRGRNNFLPHRDGRRERVLRDWGDAGQASTFRVDDINGYFAVSTKATGPAKLSISESLRDGLFYQLVPNNFVGAFADANFLGVIVLSTAVAVALVKLEKNMPDEVMWTRILTIQIIEELVHVFMMIIDWIIFVTPFAVTSLIAGAIGEQKDLAEVFTQLAWLVTATVVGLVAQFLIVYCGLYLGFIRSNPFKYYAQLIPAYATAFGGASSAAAIPQSLACIKKTGQVPDGVASFVIPLGATINMDGKCSCIYIVCGAAWMAYQNGIVPTAGEYVTLVFSATFGSMGAAPVPSASLVLMLTAYSTAFGSTEGAPEGFAYILAIDWLIDRLRTLFNCTGDHTVTAIIGNIVVKKEAKKANNINDEDLEMHGGDDKDGDLELHVENKLGD
ncbi:hypothetical protein THAOC_15516 [Thalassiosira oceanica]|uniref:Amino acid transporter n=1 Tax=Thalassiosira oceanica TaxID=159749 RepID=K0T031_THAOC|nr:hypothetical protein THAOC_15516 [Thalassiosira oceanica]|eukprot:EJK63807.1 hypothetical protein THAOC_15516 [Thalassiosira oceanica]